MFRCKHKFGRIEDGYQYCEKCGKAFAVERPECKCSWEEIEHYTITNTVMGNTLTHIYVLRCKYCGRMEVA